MSITSKQNVSRSSSISITTSMKLNTLAHEAVDDIYVNLFWWVIGVSRTFNSRGKMRKSELSREKGSSLWCFNLDHVTNASWGRKENGWKGRKSFVLLVSFWHNLVCMKPKIMQNINFWKSSEVNKSNKVSFFFLTMNHFHPSSTPPFT